MGRVPLYPGTKDETVPGASGWESIEHIGPITRTVADGALPAVRNGKLYEIKSALILQPGPAALTDGLAALENIILDPPLSATVT
jgi:hypothetical protein